MIEILDTDLLKFMSANKVAPITSYRKEQVQQTQKELSGLSPVCKLIAYYHFEKYDEKYTQESGYEFSLDYTDVLLEYKGYLLQPYKKERNSSTYKFRLVEKDKKKQCTYFDPARYGLNEPQAVGKATVSKMDAWLDYLLKQKEAEQDYILKRNGKIQEFKNKLTPFNKQLTWLEKNKGYIAKNGIRYFFEISENGSVYQTIELSGPILHTLENFAALSDNRYQQTNQNVLLLYSCDAWHSISSKELVALFSDQYQLKQYLDGLLKDGKLKSCDIECLQEIKQTQGYETNYMIEEIPINPSYQTNEQSCLNIYNEEI